MDPRGDIEGFLRSERRTHDRRLAALLFIVVSLAYGWFFQGGGFNQNVNFDLARALVERGTIRIDAYDDNTGDVSVADGHSYSNKAPGLSFLAAVPYAVIHGVIAVLAVDLTSSFVLLTAAYLTTVATCGTLGAGLAVLLFVHLRGHGADQRAAIGAALIAAFATPLFPYATMLFAHVPNAFLLFAGYHFAFRAGSPRPALAGVLSGAAVTTNYLSLFLLPLFAGAVFARARSAGARRSDAVRSVVLFAAGTMPAGALLAWYHWQAFGSPFATPLSNSDPVFLTEGALFGVFSGFSPEALWGITFSPFRGLFFLSPVLLASLWGGFRELRTGRRGEAAVILGSVLVFLALNASFNGWHGGSGIGPRYLVPVVPLLAVLLLPAARRAPKALAAAALVAFSFCFAATAVDAQPPDSLPNPLFRYSFPALFTGRTARVPEAFWIADWYQGHVSTNRQTVEERLPFQRHPPGSPASEWASFNLGELLFGRGAWLSVVPIAIWILGGSALLLMRSGRS